MSCKNGTACGGGGGGTHCECACVDGQLTPPANRAGLDALDGRLGDYRDFFADAIRRLSDPALPALRALGTRDASDPAIAWLDAWAVAADVLTFYRERLTNESYLRTAGDERALRELAALVGFKPRPGVAATGYLAYLMEQTAAPVPIPPRAKAQTMPGPGEQMQTFETGDTFVAHAEWSRMAPRVTRPAGITFIDALTRQTLRLTTASLIVSPGERVLFVFGHKLGHQVVREVASAKVDIVDGHVELQLKPRFPLVAKPKELVARLEVLRDKIVGAQVTSPDAAAAFSRLLLEIMSSFLLGGSASDGRTLAEAIAKQVETVPVPQALKDLVKLVKDTLDEVLGKLPPPAPNVDSTGSTVDDVLLTLGQQRPTQLSSSRRLTQHAGGDLSAHGQDRLTLLEATTPQLAEGLAATLNTLPVSGASNQPKVFLLRTTANTFCVFAPPVFRGNKKPTEHRVEDSDSTFAFLDAVYDGIRAGSYVIRDRPQSTVRNTPSAERTLEIFLVRAAQAVTRRAYDISGKSSRLELVELDEPLKPVPAIPAQFNFLIARTSIAALRSLLYHVQSEEVTLADDFDDRDVKLAEIELQVRVDGLQPGQWIIVAGERTDIVANKLPVPGVRAAERAMIAGIDLRPDFSAPNDELHTVISLVKPLAYTYKGSTAIVYGNVVEASHGEVVSEVLGSGDASRAGQRFTTKRPSLTFTPAATPAGVESSEVVRVNGIRYERVESLLDADPAARAYQLDVDAGGLATLTFGDGVHGARLPSGAQNVRVDYRVGIGPAGNARAKQIALLTTRPLGVTDVINPLRASGGADRDGPERIRRNAPLATRGLSRLSRLVSIEDYASVARLFAGIGHADAVRLSDGAQQVIHVTVAGVDDNPLDADGDLLMNLSATYTAFGDPTYPVAIGVRTLKVLVLEARVAVEPTVDWDTDVEPEVRRRLNGAFSFERRRLGQPAYLSEAMSVIQRTPGVAWVDVDRFGGIAESEVRTAAALAEAVDKLDRSPVSPVVGAARAGLNARWKTLPGEPRFVSAELVFLLPDVRGLLVLNPA